VTVELEECACDLYPMRFRLALIVLFVLFVLLIPFAEQEGSVPPRSCPRFVPTEQLAMSSPRCIFIQRPNI